MREVNAVVFWLGGVVATSIHEETMRALYPEAEPGSHSTLFHMLREQAEQLGVGRISPLDYCGRALEISTGSGSAEQLEARILASLQPSAGVLGVMGNLPVGCQRWLASDYPTGWLQILLVNHGLEEWFPTDRVVEIARLGLKRMVPEVFAEILRCVRQSRETVMLVDADATRAVAAVREGVSATVYVEPRRLLRDFALRKLVAGDPNAICL